MSEVITDTAVKMQSNKRDLEQVFKSIAAITNDVSLNFSNEGIHFRSMDLTHVSLLDVRLPENIFEKFQIIQSGNLAFNIDDMLKALSSFNVKDTIELKTESNTLVLIQKYTQNTIKLIEPSRQDTPLPKIPYDSILNLNSIKDFKEAIKALSKTSDYVDFETFTDNSKKLFLGGYKSGYDKDHEYTTKIILEDLDTFDYGNIKESSFTTYSLEYLKEFIKAQKDQACTIAFSRQKPIRINVKVAKLGDMDFYLAPRVES